MTAILTTNLRVRNANLIVDMVRNQNATLLTFGRPEIWENPATPGVEVSPENPKDSVAQIDYLEWPEMIGAKLVTRDDIVAMVRRVNWVSGTVYEFYDDQSEQIGLEQNFYVLTIPEYNVYKCLDNNNEGASTVKPTATGSTPFVTSPDNYKWKYMYTLTQDDVAKFLTVNHMPVHTVTANNSTVGGIFHIEVIQQGTGYTTAPSVTVYGDGSGATASATVSGGNVTKITVTSPGTGYTRASIVLTPTSGGTGASARAMISPKGGHGVNPQRELGGFFIGINVKVNGDESGVFSTANDFRKIGLMINPIIALDPPDNNNVSNGAALGGRVANVNLNDAGTGYSNSFAATFYEDGQDTAGVPSATATATLFNGGVSKVDVTAIGTGYTFEPIISFTGGGGKGAQAIAVLSGTGIGAITVTNPGAGYTSAPTVTIGGFDAAATVSATGGVIDSDGISVTNRGRNYTNPQIDFAAGGGTGASATVEVLDAYRTTYKFTVTAVTNSPFEEDEVVESVATGATAIIVEYDATDSILYVNNVQSGLTGGVFASGQTIRQVSDVTKTAQISALAYPELVPGEGDFIYVENRVKVSRSPDQTESVVIVLES